MISVIIPTYNQRGFLKNAIDSVLTQTYQDVEIIVVDDNNPDTEARKKTETLMTNYKDNSKVRYLRHEVNKNGSAARNTGFRASHGEYVAFLDDDDYWAEIKLEKQELYLRTHPEFDAVYCFTTVDGIKNPNKKFEGDILYPYMMNKVSLQTSCLLLRRSAITRINGFDESFRRHQDTEMLLRFFLIGNKMGCVPEYLSFMNSVGGNRLSGPDLDNLKKKFLNTFQTQLDVYEKMHPGRKRKIEVANYVKNFESHIASGNYNLAWRIFRKFFFKAPFVFLSQCYLLGSNHIKRKLQKTKK